MKYKTLTKNEMKNVLGGSVACSMLQYPNCNVSNCEADRTLMQCVEKVQPLPEHDDMSETMK